LGFGVYFGAEKGLECHECHVERWRDNGIYWEVSVGCANFLLVLKYSYKIQSFFLFKKKLFIQIRILIVKLIQSMYQHVFELCPVFDGHVKN
jgi:hypothetical protein